MNVRDSIGWKVERTIGATLVKVKILNFVPEKPPIGRSNPAEFLPDPTSESRIFHA
jgi:hypothetical protein